MNRINAALGGRTTAKAAARKPAPKKKPAAKKPAAAHTGHGNH